MLEPQNRRLLMDALRPPSGFQLDYAIGTTYSLDLIALLVIPLAFTFFNWEEEDGQAITEPIALLQAIRRNSDRLAIFCQGGGIKVPSKEQRLLAFLEDCVHQVTASDPNGVFHPKVWVLRFVGDNDEDVIYRVISSSRNITFDRSWDTVLVLDGTLRNRENAFRMNHPLGDFVAHLPELSERPLPKPLRLRIDQIQSEIRRVEFEDPEGLEIVRFWPLGIPGQKSWPFEASRDRFLVISPFLDKETLVDLSPIPGKSILVSREDELSSVSPELLARFEQVLVFHSSLEEADGNE